MDGKQTAFCSSKLKHCGCPVTHDWSAEVRAGHRKHWDSIHADAECIQLEEGSGQGLQCEGIVLK